MNEKLNFTYSSSEEKLNIWSHAFGLLLSVIAFPFLVIKAFSFNGILKPASFIIYGFSLIILYAASTFYHAAIYVLIAGSYTPFSLVALETNWGWYLFIFVWLFALVGVILKLFFTGRYNKLSTAMYLLMGWQVVFFINPLIENVSSFSLNYLFIGGVFYSIGAILYMIKRLPYNHAIFHLFVLLGSLSHFMAIYYIQ